MSRNGVRGWPSFLLRDIPPELRDRIEADAAYSEESLAEVMRSILCARFSLECDRVEAFSGPPAPIPRTATMIVRMQPELFHAIKAEADTSGESMRSLILGTLTAHYQEEAVT